MPWLAVSVELERASAEAFSEALLAAGARSVSVENPEDARPRLTALLDASADAAAFVAKAAGTAALRDLPAFRITSVADADWVRQSQAQFSPLAIGERLWIGASWHEPPAAAPPVLRIDPGLAFGTGDHATTRLVLRFLASTIRGGERVLDYGCGSGILALAAAKFGAARCDAVDIDPLALEATAANACANAVALRVMLPDALGPERYDIVVSNILAKTLTVLAPLLARRTAHAGRIALSGILAGQAAEIGAAYAPWFSLDAPLIEEGWALIAGRRT